MGADDLDSQFEKGIDLFNQREFYECHDTIEEVWLQESSDRQPFLQGLIQAAVAFHHYQHGKWGAARSMLQLALEKLSPCKPTFEGFDILALVGSLTAWKAALNQALRDPPRPDRIDLPYPTIRRGSLTEAERQ